MLVLRIADKEVDKQNRLLKIMEGSKIFLKRAQYDSTTYAFHLLYNLNTQNHTEKQIFQLKFSFFLIELKVTKSEISIYSYNAYLFIYYKFSLNATRLS